MDICLDVDFLPDMNNVYIMHMPIKGPVLRIFAFMQCLMLDVWSKIDYVVISLSDILSHSSQWFE